MMIEESLKVNKVSQISTTTIVVSVECQKHSVQQRNTCLYTIILSPFPLLFLMNWRPITDLLAFQKSHIFYLSFKHIGTTCY